MRTPPHWLTVILWTGVVSALVWVAVFPFVPVSWLQARDANGDIIDLIRSHRTTVSFHQAWSSEGWRWVGWGGRLLPALVVLGAVVVGVWRRRAPSPPRDATGAQRIPTPVERWRHRRLLVGGLLVVASGAAFWFGRVPVPVLITYGDSIKLIQQIGEASWVFPAEPLMMHLFNLVSRGLSAWRGAPDGLLAGQWTALACGVVYVACLWILASSRRSGTAGALLLWLAFAGTGTATQFFGVVETTVLQTAAAAGFLATCVLALQEPVGSTVRARRLLLVHVWMGILLSAHAAGVAFLPALVMLWIVVGRQERRHRVDRNRRLVSWRHGLPALLAAWTPWLVFVWWPFTRLGNLGNSAGGADTFRFVPWDVETARQSSSYVYYGMLSGLHALDVSAALLAACPFALLLLVAAAVLRRRAGGHGDEAQAAIAAVLRLAALGCAAVVLLWDFDFGMWGDWNIVTCYLVPLHLCAWVEFDEALHRSVPAEWSRWMLVVPLVVTQVALGLGLWLQLHPPGVP